MRARLKAGSPAMLEDGDVDEVIAAEVGSEETGSEGRAQAVKLVNE